MYIGEKFIETESRKSSIGLENLRIINFFKFILLVFS